MATTPGSGNAPQESMGASMPKQSTAAPASRRRRLLIAALAVALLVPIGFRILNSKENAAALEAIDNRDFEAALTYLKKDLENHPADQATLLLAAQTARRLR